MLVYKATDQDMSCHMGQGTFRYRLGIPAVADASKCGSTGLHACEYVLDCTRYYSLGGGHRFFAASAEGDIAEDGKDTRISCTKLTLLNELTNKDIARQAIRFIKAHPHRDGWAIEGRMLDVAEDSAGMQIPDGIAIARGEDPRARGCAGAHLGFIRETGGRITEAYLLTVGEGNGLIRPDTWYTIEMAAEALRGERR